MHISKSLQKLDSNLDSPILDLSMLKADERILVALSGGADSVALLLRLHDAGQNLHAAHINHGLRGAESENDEIFVRELCRNLNIEITTQRVRIENRGGHFSENSARIARYAALVEIAHAQNCSSIATGHTANDVLETILLNLSRGAAVRGMAGIAAHRVLDSSLQIVRPLLQSTREESEKTCEIRGISWRNDSSNADLRLKRNLVRREIVPLLSAVAGKEIATLARQSSRAANLWRDDLQFLDDSARELLETLKLPSRENVLALDGLRFRELAPSMQRRVLRLAAQNVASQQITSQQIADVQNVTNRVLDFADADCFERIADTPNADVQIADAQDVTNRVLDFADGLKEIADARIAVGCEVVADAEIFEIGSAKIEEVRLQVLENGRRRVWQWRGGLHVEWTGAKSGNRIRVWCVETKVKSTQEKPSSLL